MDDLPRHVPTASARGGACQRRPYAGEPLAAAPDGRVVSETKTGLLVLKKTPAVSD